MASSLTLSLSTHPSQVWFDDHHLPHRLSYLSLVTPPHPPHTQLMSSQPSSSFICNASLHTRRALMNGCSNR